MSLKVYFQPAAEAQLEQIESYIEERASAVIAERFIDAIVARCERLSAFPRRGTPRDDLGPGIRTIAHRRSVTIAYAVLEDRVEILGIFYGGQDIEAAFSAS